jgi:hypothetical protein
MSDLTAPLPRRIRLGTHASISSRSQIYLGAEGIEIDEHTGFASGQRTRVLFDEVQLVTLDRRRSKPGLWISAAGIVFIVLCCLIAFSGSKEHGTEMTAAVYGFTALLLSAPFWLYLTIHLIFGADHVTIFGKRSTAKMSFNFRKARARDVFAIIRDRVTQHTKSATPALASEIRAPGLPIA